MVAPPLPSEPRASARSARQPRRPDKEAGCLPARRSACLIDRQRPHPGTVRRQAERHTRFTGNRVRAPAGTGRALPTGGELCGQRQRPRDRESTKLCTTVDKREIRGLTSDDMSRRTYKSPAGSALRSSRIQQRASAPANYLTVANPTSGYVFYALGHMTSRRAHRSVGPSVHRLSSAAGSGAAVSPARGGGRPAPCSPRVARDPRGW